MNRLTPTARPRTRQTGLDQGEVLLEHLHALTHAFKSQGREAFAADGQGLGPTEARALGFIARHEGCTQQDLASHSGRDKAQIARLIAQLDERGLVERRADAHDRRCQRLHLTGAGHALQDGMRQMRRELLEKMLDGFTPAERSALSGLLERMRGNVAAD